VTIDGRDQLELERAVGPARSPLAFEGHLLDGRDVSLFDCNLAYRGSPRNGPYVEAWHVHNPVVGMHVGSLDEPVIEAVRVRLHGLAEALGVSGLSVSSSDISSTNDKHLAIEWEEPDPVEARFGGAMLTLRSHPSFEHRSEFDLGISNRSLAELRPDAPISLAGAYSCVDDLMSLVALATETAVKITMFEVAPTDGGEKAAVRYGARSWYGPDPSTEEALFTFADLAGDAPTFIERFERFRRDQPEAAELLFEYQVFRSALTPADRFLYLARFLEAFHRRTAPAKTNFVARIVALLTGPGSPARAAFGGSAQDLAEVIRDTRNYYVHYDPKLHGRARHGVILDDLADRVWCVVRSVLWSDLGLPPGNIEQMLGSDWRYTRATENPL
jgi:hypothetical protein